MTEPRRANKNPATTAPNFTHLTCRAFICHLPADECDACLRLRSNAEVIVMAS